MALVSLRLGDKQRVVEITEDLLQRDPTNPTGNLQAERRVTTLMDYALPRSDDIPAMVIDHLEVPIAPRVLSRL